MVAVTDINSRVFGLSAGDQLPTGLYRFGKLYNVFATRGGREGSVWSNTDSQGLSWADCAAHALLS